MYVRDCVKTSLSPQRGWLLLPGYVYINRVFLKYPHFLLSEIGRSFENRSFIVAVLCSVCVCVYCVRCMYGWVVCRACAVLCISPVCICGCVGVCIRSLCGRVGFVKNLFQLYLMPFTSIITLNCMSEYARVPRVYLSHCGYIHITGIVYL